jgi:hypothetical protein
VHERQPVAVAGEDVAARERLERLLGGRLVVSGQLGGERRVGALAQERDRARHRRRGRREAVQTLQHDGRDRLRAELAHGRGLGVGRAQLLVQHLVQELADEERVAAGRLVAGGAEGRAGTRVDRGPHPLADGRAGQRGRAQEPCPGIGDEAAQHLALLLRPRAGAEHQRDGQVLEPAGEEAEEAHARLVRPLGVVDAHEQRTVGGEVRAQPVQAVQPCVGGLVLARARVLEHRAGQTGGAGQPAVALRVVGREQRRLEQLAHDAEGEGAFEL